MMNQMFYIVLILLSNFSFSKTIESLHTVFRVYAIIPGRLLCKMCTVLELNLYERF